MIEDKYKKILAYGIIILFIGASFLPSISGEIGKTNIEQIVEIPSGFPLNNDYVNAYWKFDECSGNILEDSSGHDYDGTIYGATWTTGYSGCALDFDGIDDYVDLNNYAQNNLGFNKTDDLIFIFRFNSSSSDTGIIYGMSNKPAYGYNPGVHIALNSNGKLEFKAWKTNCGIQLPSANTYNDGEWHYVKIYYNGITSNPTVDIYVDGELDVSTEHWVCDFYSDQFYRAKIGERSNDSEYNFDGLVDDFKIIKYPGGNQQEPPIIDGPTYGNPNVEYDFTFTTYDPEGDNISLYIDWGDDDPDEWIGPYKSGEAVTVSHEWYEDGYYNITAKSQDIWHASYWSEPFVTKIGNTAPDPPEIIGPHCGDPGVGYEYTFITEDQEGNDVYFYVDWGDGTYDDWFGPFPSGQQVTATHAWDSKGEYEIKAKAKDEYNNESGWSIPFIMRIGDEPPTAPNIGGPKTGIAGIEYVYTFQSTDPEGNRVCYQINWGDGNEEETVYYASGIEVTARHKWNDQGEYIIEARAKDEFCGFYGNWSQYVVTMPRSRAIDFNLLELLFERFSNAFPLIRQLLGV